mgnify:CR=1 FL=1
MNGMISLTCAVQCKVPYCDATEEYTDNGVLLLPDSYSETGEPTRLVISCHGAGGTVTTDDAQVLHQTLTHYLLANGFAVMDMAGLPAAFAAKYGIDLLNNIGSPVATDAYVAGYRKCVSGFNLKKEVLVHGASMGGISSVNLVLSGRVPTLVQTGFCPVLDTYEEIFLHPWSNGAPKTALEKFYSLDPDRYDETKIAPNNPMTNEKALRYPVPLYFWQCADDGTVSPAVTEKFVARVNGAGGFAALTVFPSGGHEPQLYGDYLERPCGNTFFRGETLRITAAVEGVYSVFRNYR